jgi:hypothetical protein
MRAVHASTSDSRPIFDDLIVDFDEIKIPLRRGHKASAEKLIRHSLSRSWKIGSFCRSPPRFAEYNAKFSLGLS